MGEPDGGVGGGGVRQDQAELLSTHIRIVRSDSIDADAIMFCRGCVCEIWANEKRVVERGTRTELTATETTTSTEPRNPHGKEKGLRKKQRRTYRYGPLIPEQSLYSANPTDTPSHLHYPRLSTFHPSR